MTRSELEKLQILEIDTKLYKQILENWDHIAKPLNGLGDFEKTMARIGAILGDESIDIHKRAIVMMCGDNGIIEEGVSQSGCDVTATVSALMGAGVSSVCKISKLAKADTFPIDIGIKDTSDIPGVINKKVCKGTKNFVIESAMSEEEALQAISVGIEMVKELKDKGYRILATGEMGIGNTTTSSALLAGLLNLSGKQVAGRGAGLSNEGLAKKILVIDKAKEKYDLRNATAFECLMNVGGLDIAGLCGIFIGGAVYRVPIVIDGLISGTAALVAERMCPGVKAYCFASHKGAEKGLSLVLNELGLEPMINGNMALGEGTGAVMLFPLLDMVLSIYRDGTKFSETDIDQYKRFE